MMNSTSTDKLLTRVRSLLERSERITRDDCRALFEVKNLLDLARLARIPRERRNGRTSSYTAAWPVNYAGEHPEFFLSEAETSAPEGTGYIALRCHWQQGETLELWRERLRQFSGGSLPAIVHLSPSFIIALAAAEGQPVGRIIGELHEAGTIVITGEGAELFDEGWRGENASHAPSQQAWVEVHRAAHIIGLKTGAAMTYGTVDHPDAYAAHLDTIRTLQDETHCFVSFAPLALHNRSIASHLTAPTAAQTMRAISIARIFLDNIDHIAAVPALVSTEVAVVGLDHGADLLDTTIAVGDVHAEDRQSDIGSGLRVVDESAAASFAPVSPAHLRKRIEEARWNAQAVDTSYREIEIPESV